MARRGPIPLQPLFDLPDVLGDGKPETVGIAATGELLLVVRTPRSKVRTVVGVLDGEVRRTCIGEHGKKLRHVQRLPDDRLLLARTKSSKAVVFEPSGEPCEEIALRYGMQALQADAAGNIWLCHSNPGWLSEFSACGEEVARIETLTSDGRRPFSTALNVASETGTWVAWSGPGINAISKLENGLEAQRWGGGIYQAPCFAVTESHVLVPGRFRDAASMVWDIGVEEDRRYFHLADLVEGEPKLKWKTLRLGGVDGEIIHCDWFLARGPWVYLEHGGRCYRVDLPELAERAFD